VRVLNVGFFLVGIAATNLPLAPQDVIPSLNQNLAPDNALRFTFFQHRRDFTRLVGMCNQDKHLVRIADDFTWLDTDSSWPRENIGLSESRWNSYRQIFTKLALKGGMSRSEDYPSAIFFTTDAEGTILNTIYKGYVYSPHPLSPIRNSLEDIPLDLVKGHADFFEPIAPNWYLFVEFYL
jgi:hypothetical protein